MFGFGIKAKLFDLKNSIAIRWKNKMCRPNLFNLRTPERVGAVYHHPSDMCVTDRIMLYALVRGLRPKTALEIGSRWGGSARIISNAMHENGTGFLVGIDPETSLFRAKEKELHGRFRLVQGYSPEAIPAAVKYLGDGRVDFVFIDALHTHDAVRDDFLGVLPFLREGSHVLFHDAYHQGIQKAITDILSETEGLFDMGFITRNPEVREPVSYQGLRLIRVGKVKGQDLIQDAYARHGMQPTIFHHALRNYDEFANRIGKGATVAEIEQINSILRDGTRQKG